MSLSPQTAAASGVPGPPEFITVQTCLFFLVPLSVQCVLLVRIFAVYPPYTLSWPRRILIYGTLGTIMVARVCNAAIDVHKVDVGARTSHNWVAAAQLAWGLPYSKVDVFLQLAFDVCVSFQLLGLPCADCWPQHRVYAVPTPYPTRRSA